jgi:alkylresorcinol/alkylpyrone synthase
LQCQFVVDERSPSIAAVACALPPHYVDQETLIAAFRALWGARPGAHHLEALHRAVGVEGRHLALPMAEYYAIDSFAKANGAWQRVALDLAEAATRQALERAGLAPAHIDHVFFVTVTGFATPSTDARLVNRMGLRSDVKRTPIFGLGCVAGASALARASDYLRAFPTETALVLSVELCSLTLQREDLSVANLIASGLFGDGAAATILRGSDCAAPGPRVLGTRAVFYRDTEDLMGWDLCDSGFKVVLSARVPEVIRAHIGGDVDEFLAAHGLDRRSIRHIVAHTGGPKVLQAIEAALALPAGALERSWQSLKTVGNLSSASVLFVLEDLLRAGVARPGDHGLVAAMGPGFCAELALLGW